MLHVGPLTFRSRAFHGGRRLDLGARALGWCRRNCRFDLRSRPSGLCLSGSRLLLIASRQRCHHDCPEHCQKHLHLCLPSSVVVRRPTSASIQYRASTRFFARWRLCTLTTASSSLGVLGDLAVQPPMLRICWNRQVCQEGQAITHHTSNITHPAGRPVWRDRLWGVCRRRLRKRRRRLCRRSGATRR